MDAKIADAQKMVSDAEEKSTLPCIGDAFEFDYTYRDGSTVAIGLKVVDVTAEHILYKKTYSSHIYPMTHDVWLANTDNRRPAQPATIAALDDETE